MLASLNNKSRKLKKFDSFFTNQICLTQRPDCHWTTPTKMMKNKLELNYLSVIIILLKLLMCSSMQMHYQEHC